MDVYTGSYINGAKLYLIDGTQVIVGRKDRGDLTSTWDFTLDSDMTFVGL